MYSLASTDNLLVCDLWRERCQADGKSYRFDLKPTSSTEPKDPVPSLLPVGVTSVKTNCCSSLLFLNAWPTSRLSKKAMSQC